MSEKGQSGSSAPGEGKIRPDLEEAVEVWSQMNDSSLLRGVAAVILGFLVLTFGSVFAGRALISATGVGPSDSVTSTFIGVSIASRVLLALLAGYLTARAAPRAPRVHAGVLAGALAFFSVAAIIGLTAGGGLQDPAWYPIVMLFVGPVGVVVGGALKRGS